MVSPSTDSIVRSSSWVSFGTIPGTTMRSPCCQSVGASGSSNARSPAAGGLDSSVQAVFSAPWIVRSPPTNRPRPSLVGSCSSSIGPRSRNVIRASTSCRIGVSEVPISSVLPGSDITVSASRRVWAVGSKVSVPSTRSQSRQAVSPVIVTETPSRISTRASSSGISSSDQTAGSSQEPLSTARCVASSAAPLGCCSELGSRPFPSGAPSLRIESSAVHPAAAPVASAAMPCRILRLLAICMSEHTSQRSEIRCG
jgi:hypothetical protein